MSHTDSALDRLQTAAGLLARRPALLFAGTLRTLLTLIGVFLVAAAWHVAGGLSFDLLATTNRYGARSVPSHAALRDALLRGAITLGVSGISYVLLRVITAPVAAAADRVALGETDVVRSVRSELGAVVGVALRRGVARLGLWLLWTLLAVAVYLSAGTALEAVGYAAGLYTVVPWAATVAAVVGAGLVGVVGATALSWEPGAVGRVDGADHRSGVRRARARPLATVLDSVVVTLLSLMPLCAGVVAVVLADGVGLGNGATLLWAVAAAVVVGLVTGSFAAAYRSVALGLDRTAPSVRTDANADSEGHTPTVPLARVVVAVAVVTAAAGVGVAVRTADLRPVAAERAPPPAVESTTADEVVQRAVVSLTDRSRTVRLQYSSRRLYDNGTRGPWEDSGRVVVLIDPVDRRYLGYRAFELDDGWSEDAAYMTPTWAVEATTEGRSSAAETTDVSSRARALLSASADRPATPAYTMGSDGHSGVLGETISSSFLTDEGQTVVGTTGWSVRNRTDSRLVYESTTPETVAAFAQLNTGDRGDLRSVRVAVTPDTGTVVGATVRYSYNATDDPGVVESRARYTVESVGETDVSPPGGGRPPLSVAMDALFY